MSKLFATLGLAALVALSACTPAAEPPPMAGTPADEDAIRTMIQDVANAWNNMDAAALAAMVTEDYEGINAEGTHIQGRAGYRAQLDTEFAEERPEGFALSLSTGYIDWKNGDVASVGGTYQLAGLPEGMPNTGSWLVVFERGDTGLLMSNALVAAYVPPPPMEGGQ